MTSELPTGTITLLFTDIEGSTQLLQQLGRESYVEVLEAHRRLLREAFTAHGGVEVEMQGDSFFFAFASAQEAVAAAWHGQRALNAHAWKSEPIRVRIGLHTGEPIPHGELYAGLDVHRVARVMSVAHGGQVVLTQATRGVLSEDVELRDLGLHRLKDLAEPERLFQLGSEEFPPLRSLNATNLPVQPSALIGRERELAELIELVSSSRLVTVTGAGGTGKTRLALQAAAERVDDYPDGVWWVPLAALREPELVEPAIAQAVGSKNGLAEHLRGKRTLLLLDNLEQLLEAAPRLSELLTGTEAVTLLVTSREPLHVRGEREYPLEPLADEEAVALFSERARSVRPGFEPDEAVAEICRRLEGMPLAIELAAARVKVLEPAVLLERLEHLLPVLTGGTRDAPERQRTLSATIAWSHELLGPEEKTLFGRLAVFAGGFTLAAAEELCEADLDALTSLVDKSLVRQRGDRFAMLETIREYALERLEESGEAEELRRLHAEHYLALAEEATPQVLEDDQRTSLVRLEREHDNLRAALSCLREEGEPMLVLRLAGALGHFWLVRGYWDEGRSWLEDALAQSPEPTATRGQALWCLSGLEFRRDRERARAAVGEAVAIFRALGDEYHLAGSLCYAAVIALSMGGARDQARALYEEAGELATRSGNRGALSGTLGNLGGLAVKEGDYERAYDLYEQALAISREIGNPTGIAPTLFNLGLLAFQLGRYAEALAWFQESVVPAREIEWKELLAKAVEMAGAALALLGDGERAAPLLGHGESLRAELACDLEEDEQEVRDTAVGALRGQLGERLDSLFAEGRALTLEEAVELALAELPIAAAPPPTGT